jgi:hypothetical protein
LWRNFFPAKTRQRNYHPVPGRRTVSLLQCLKQKCEARRGSIRDEARLERRTTVIYDPTILTTLPTYRVDRPVTTSQFVQQFSCPEVAVVVLTDALIALLVRGGGGETRHLKTHAASVSAIAARIVLEAVEGIIDDGEAEVAERLAEREAEMLEEWCLDSPCDDYR